MGPLEREVTEVLLEGWRPLAEYGCFYPASEGDCLETAREPACMSCEAQRWVRSKEKELAA